MTQGPYEAAWREIKRQRPGADDLDDDLRNVLVYDAFDLRAVVDAVLGAVGEVRTSEEC